MASSDSGAMPEVATEAIVVVDLVESTLTSNLFGWYAVGRQAIRDLRALIGEVGERRGLRCLRSTGDGYLLTFHDPQSAERAALRAVEAVFELLNRVCPPQSRGSPRSAHSICAARSIWARWTLFSNDREGPHVSLAFRLEEISRASLPAALNPIRPSSFRCRIMSCAARKSPGSCHAAQAHGRWSASGCSN